MAFTKIFDDSFTGSAVALNGRTPDTQGTSWISDHVGWVADSGFLVRSDIGRARPSDTFANDQAVAMEFHTRGTYIAIGLRYQAPGSQDYNFQCYMVTWEATGLTLWRLDGGANNGSHWVSLGTSTPSFSAGDVVYLQAMGTGVVASVNSVVQVNTADATWSSGTLLVWADAGGGNVGDNFQGFQDAAGSAVPGVGALSLTGQGLSLGFTINLPDEL